MKKLNSIIFASDLSKVEYVFRDKILARLAKVSNFNPTIVTPQNIDDIDLSEIDVIFATWGMFVPNAEQFERLKNLKAVFYAAGETEYFCRPFLARGIKVTTAWQVNAVPVAEYCLAQILLSLKNFHTVSRSVTSRSMWHKRNVGSGAYDQNVALIGNGAISTKLQELLKPFDLNVTVIPSNEEQLSTALEEVFANSQVISNHLPNCQNTNGIFDAKLFKLMPKNAVFMNTGRGQQVNERDLIEVLTEREDLSAILDVTFPEPPLENSKLFEMDNIILSPHIAGSQNIEVCRMADSAIDEYCRFIQGQELHYPVIEEMLIAN